MLCFAAILTAIAGPQDPAPVAGWQAERLANGVEINVLQVATRQVSVFTFLPVGLDGDPRGRAQFAHLAEHMLIRSTDPRQLRVGELQLNGETTNRVMRLESFAPADQWQAAVRRHPRWLSVTGCDPAVLAREKLRIEGEERTTVARGFNHKWAVAAWAQFVAGADHAAVHGDVAAATVAQVQDYLRTRIDRGQARMFVVGPRPAAEVVALVRAEFRRQAPDQVAPPVGRGGEPAAVGEGGEPAVPAGHRRATWDLAADHYLEWYPLPAGTTAAEVEVLSQVVQAACFQHRTLARIPGRALAGQVVRGGRRCLVLSVGRPAATRVEDLQAAFRGALQRVPLLAAFQVRGDRLAAPFVGVPDFAAQRRQVQQPRQRDLLEANFALQCGYASMRLEVPIAGVAAAFRAVDGGRIARLAREHCGVAARRSVAIAPREQQRAPK